MNKRKVVILGPEVSGKTVTYQLMRNDEINFKSIYEPTDKFSNCQLQLLKNGAMELDLWDVSGKLPHLWSHYFTGGVHGVIYVVDNLLLTGSLLSQEDLKLKDEIEAYYKTVQQQILNIIINNFEVPLAIVVNCRQDMQEIDDRKSNHSSGSQGPKKVLTHIDKEWFDKNINDKIELKKTNYQIFTANLSTQQGLATALKEYQINKKLNEELTKMDLLQSNSLDHDFIKNDMVKYMTLWLLNHMTPNAKKMAQKV